ncbi:recombinase family protein [Paenibacillus sp. 1P03SA]|uniref:recombinase family protein n=1 Tax=Paenibacillus sp. 1P03SA TaxID=3132294 RepID=UPI0039A011BD
MRVVLYIRVSTDDQARDGFSIEAQKRKLISYCDSQDWTVTDVYIDEGFSAKDLNRPEMKRMLEDLEDNKFDMVLVYKLDRLTRSTADCDKLLKLFESHKVMFQSSTESFETRTATGRLFIRLISDLAQWERENIAERVRFGMEQMVTEGRRPGGRYPYGYTKEGVLIPEEAAVIRRIRDMYMKDNLSLKKIAVTLVQEGVTRRGYDWTKSSVSLTLENIYYAGIIRFGSKMANGKYVNRKKELRTEILDSVGSHEPVWTLDEFNEHLEILRARSNSGYSRLGDYWFTGLLKCGKCGSGMFGRLTNERIRKDGSRARVVYYMCRRKWANKSCTMPIIRQKHVEHLLFEFIESIIIDPNITEEKMKKVKSERKNKEKEIQKHKRNIEETQERMKKWQYMFVNDLISADDLRERLNEERVKESELKSELEKINVNNQETDYIISQLKEMKELWPLFDDKEKAEISKIIFKEITLYTDLENVKGVKNKFFEASLSAKYR